ncbi:MAG: hypothetical protein JO197_07425 [Acidobacteria bacterium]|nr:hypothetical protein [Acidobacteriota bacterium]MBV9475781.1 hypothetical protein [Acidobacteriota bacterium]
MSEISMLWTVAGVVVLAALVVAFIKMRQKDLLDAIAQKRKGSSKLVTRAEYVEGVEKIPVVLSVSDDTLYYENSDLEAMFELARLDEIEYADELSTGKNLAAGAHVLRLRSHGTTFEYVLNPGDDAKWRSALPARRLSRSAAAV